MFSFLNIFSQKDKLVDTTLLTSNDSLAEKNNQDYSILYSRGNTSIVGIQDKNLLPGIYKNHLLELIIFDDSDNNQCLVKAEHSSYTNSNTQAKVTNHFKYIFIIK